MKKPSTYVPLSYGLFLFLFGMLCCAFRQDTVSFTPSPAIDTAQFRIDLLPTTAAGPMKISISTEAKVPTNIRLEWQVLLNGLPGQKGIFPNVSLIPHHPTLLRLPVKLSPGNEEAWLRVTCRRPHSTFVRLLPLRPWHGDPAIAPAGDLTFSDSNNVFTITAPGTFIGFDKQTGWLLHYEAGHVLLMDDTAGVQPALWPTIPPRLQLFSTSTGPQLVIVRAEYTMPETASLLHLSYTINAAGDMLVNQVLEADTAQHIPDSVHLPVLPGFGMRWLLPAGLDTVTWFGAADPAVPPSSAPLASSSTPAAPIPPAIVHRPLTPATDTRETRWLTITGRQGTGLRIAADSAFLETKTVSFTDSTGHTTQMLLLNSPSGYTRQYSYKLTPVAKPI
jgi:beta-galactosidase